MPLISMHLRRSGCRRPQGFTLVELLTVIAVIGVLAGILIPVIGRVRDSARASQCLNNLRQMGTAALLYSQDNQQRTPPLSYLFYQKLWPYTYSSSDKTLVISGADLPEDLAGTLFECPKASDDAAPTVTTKRSYGVNSSLAPGVALAEKNTIGVKLSLIEFPTLAALFGDVKNSSALRSTTCNPRHSDKMNVVFVDGHAAAVTLTSEITDTGSWNTNPFWVGIQR